MCHRAPLAGRHDDVREARDAASYDLAPNLLRVDVPQPTHSAMSIDTLAGPLKTLLPTWHFDPDDRHNIGPRDRADARRKSATSPPYGDSLVLYGASHDVLSHYGHLVPTLTAEERQRATQFRRVTDRDDFLAAHVLVRVAAARFAGGTPQAFIVRQRCLQCGGAHGRPTLEGWPDLHVSLSHTRGSVAVACAAHRVGVDIEHWDQPIPDLQAGDFFTRHECAALLALAADAPAVTNEAPAPSPRALSLYRLWTRKECLVKMGAAEFDRLGTIDLSGLPTIDPLIHAWHRHVAFERWLFSDWLDSDLRITGAAIGLAAAQIDKIVA